MRFGGRLRKGKKFWLVEIPAFHALTQGRTRREALLMAKDLVETLADRDEFEVTVHPGTAGGFEIEANHVGTLVALLLRRQRERRGLTLAEVAERLGQTSRNAYARYEQGRAMPTVEKLEQLLSAIAPEQKIVWRIAA